MWTHLKELPQSHSNRAKPHSLSRGTGSYLTSHSWHIDTCSEMSLLCQIWHLPLTPCSQMSGSQMSLLCQVWHIWHPAVKCQDCVKPDIYSWHFHPPLLWSEVRITLNLTPPWHFDTCSDISCLCQMAPTSPWYFEMSAVKCQSSVKWHLITLRHTCNELSAMSRCVVTSSSNEILVIVSVTSCKQRQSLL